MTYVIGSFSDLLWYVICRQIGKNLEKWSKNDVLYG